MTDQPTIFLIIKEGIANYFKVYHSGNDLEFFPPQSHKDLSEIDFNDYTSCITFSSVKNGCILVSCSEEFLSEFIKLVLGPRIDLKEEYYTDMVGEMSNTLAGYFQKFYGDGFAISTPRFIKKADQLTNTKNGSSTSSFEVVSFDWIGFESKVVVMLSG